MNDKQVWLARQIDHGTSLQFQGRLIEAIEDCLLRYGSYGLSFLDVGFGSRLNLELWRNEDVTGMDVNPGIIDDVLKFGRQKVLLADSHESGVADNSYDVLFSSHTFEHSYDPTLLAKEFERIAKKTIYLIIPLEGKIETKAHYSHFEKPEDVLQHFTWPWITVEKRRQSGDYRFIFEKE